MGEEKGNVLLISDVAHNKLHISFFLRDMFKRLFHKYRHLELCVSEDSNFCPTYIAKVVECVGQPFSHVLVKSLQELFFPSIYLIEFSKEFYYFLFNQSTTCFYSLNN